MAQIYKKSGSFSTSTSDETLILDVRQGMIYPFAFTGSFENNLLVSSSWSEIRLGMYFSCVSGSSGSLANGDTGNNANGPNEALTCVTPADFITFGIKDSWSGVLPGFSGSYFVGVGSCSTGSTNNVSNKVSATEIRMGSSDNLMAFGMVGNYLITASLLGSPAQAPMEFVTDPSVSGSSAYCGFYAIRLILNNSGSTTAPNTQSFSIQTSFKTNQTIYTVSQLMQDIQTFGANEYPAAGGFDTVSWVSASVALPIPDSFWLRWPFNTNRIRLSAIFAKRYV